MSDRERRYTRNELALILDAADAPVVTEPGASRGRMGLTLAEIEAIAAEVGVAPGAVARAARRLPLAAEGELAHLLGGPARMQLAFSAAGAADAAMRDRVLEAARSVTAEQGSVARTESTLEWHTATLAVNVVGAGGETRVLIVGDRRSLAAIVGSLTTVVAGMAIGITGAILEPTGVVQVTGLVGGIMGAGLLTGRTIWARSTARFRRMLARLSDAVADALQPVEEPRP